MSCLKLLFLGAPRIERDGVPVTVDTRKAIALIAYLAVTRQSHSRDALATLLWPEYDQSGARAALRRTLSVLNRALDGDWLEAGRGTIGLRRDESLWLDVDQFHARLAECRTHGHPEADVCPACLPPLADAVTLYRDDFLSGFSLRDSPNFDDWQFFQAEGLRRELASALERLARGHSMAGEFEPAITYARRWLMLDPLHEPAHRLLMQLYAFAGQRAASLRQYRDCVRVLEQELGVPPLEATTQLYESIKENRELAQGVGGWGLGVGDRGSAIGHRGARVTVDGGTSSAASVPPTPDSRLPTPDSRLPTPNPQPPTPTYPLVGRAAEWTALLKAYAAIGPDGHLVVLEGEAGIGKTRLAEALLLHVQRRNAATITVRCYEGETNLAYGPFIAALRAAVGQPDRARWLEEIPPHALSEATRLLPEMASLQPALPPAPPLDSPGAQSRFFEGVSQVLLAACGGMPPGLLFFDDLHWADAASLDLLTYLLRRLRGRPVCVVVTWRSEQVPAGHRLRYLEAEMERAAMATVLPLGRLSRSAVLELVQAVATSGTALPEGIGGHLHQETEGLPFFLVEYLAAMAQGMQLDPNTDWSLPGGVRDLLHSRLHAVSETAGQLLNTAAVIGRSFDFDTLRMASGRGEEETLSALEELIAHGLVAEVRGAAGDGALIYDFGHEKLRTLVYEETSLARRRLLHRRIAEALAGRARGQRNSGALAGQIAHHYRLAGQDAEAAEYFKLAGEHARSLYANAEALAHFRTALALGHPDTAALYEAVGDLQTLGGEYSAALTSYETAAALCDEDALAGLEHKLANVHHRRGEWELAESHFEAALAALGEAGPAEEQARLYADWSLAAHHQGQTGKALDLARRALDLAESARDTRALAQAHNILGILTHDQGNLQAARHHLEQSLRLAETLGDVSARVAALNNLALVYSAGGELEQARALTETALGLCKSQGDRHREAALHNNLADLLHAAGQFEAAMAHLKQAVTIFAEIGAEAGTLQPEIWKLVEW